MNIPFDATISIIDVFALMIAAVGAVLGIINTWNSLNLRKLRLKVIPKLAFSLHEEDEEGYVIEVINLSTFSIEVTEIGFLYKNTEDRAVMVNPMILDGKSLPYRLEPRSAFSAYNPNIRKLKNKRSIKCAYADTSCGSRITGKSKSLKNIIKWDH